MRAKGGDKGKKCIFKIRKSTIQKYKKLPTTKIEPDSPLSGIHVSQGKIRKIIISPSKPRKFIQIKKSPKKYSKFRIKNLKRIKIHHSAKK